MSDRRSQRSPGFVTIGVAEHRQHRLTTLLDADRLLHKSLHAALAGFRVCAYLERRPGGKGLLWG